MTIDDNKLVYAGVSVIIQNDRNEFLLGKRIHSTGNGLYSLPGGKIDKGETAKEAAVRELYEEANVVIDKNDLVYSGYSDDIFESEDVQYITLYFYVRDNAEGFKNLEPDKCEGWEFLSLESLKELGEDDFFCDTYQVLKDCEIDF